MGNEDMVDNCLLRGAYPIVALIREEDVALLVEGQGDGESEGGLRGRSTAGRTAVS